MGGVSARFAGYAAVFGVPDRGGDVVVAGAFGTAGAVPLLWQHGGAPVGRAEVREDARGLRVIGEVTAPGLAALVRSGAVTGLSFGFRALAVERSAWRVLRRVELIEVSLVRRPMQPLARVHAVAP